MDPHQFIPFGGNETPVISEEQANIVVLPLCYEHAPSYGTGSYNGPLYLLEASEQLEVLDEETLVDWSLRGIHTLEPLYPDNNPEKAMSQIKEAALSPLGRQQFLLALGGDHAISIGIISAVAEIYPDAGVLQVDAHLDLRDQWNGSRFNHACVMRRVKEDLRLPFVQVGIRSFSPEEATFIKKHGITPFYAHEIFPWDDSWIRQVVNLLPEKVYITIDLDGLDPSVIPGTGTPEPGGLSYRQLTAMIKAVGSARRVVGADINELAKMPHCQVSEFTAAKLATKLFVYCT